jgi:hypothetical protein
VGRVGIGPARIEAGGIDLTAVYGVLVRMMTLGTLEQVVFRVDALDWLAALGVPVLNPPRAVEAAVDKYLELARLEAAGVPRPRDLGGRVGGRGAGGLRGARGRRHRQEAGRTLCELFGAWLRAEGHTRNPGATADLVCAGLFAALRDGTIALPRPTGPAAWSWS